MTLDYLAQYAAYLSEFSLPGGALAARRGRSEPSHRSISQITKAARPTGIAGILSSGSPGLGHGIMRRESAAYFRRGALDYDRIGATAKGVLVSCAACVREDTRREDHVNIYCEDSQHSGRSARRISDEPAAFPCGRITGSAATLNSNRRVL